MAQLKAPLLSFKASGSIAKAMVFGQWKGINWVRQHIVPANPNTALQITQRGYLTAANALWHNITYPNNALDLVMWDKLAGISYTPLSGFNEYIKMYVAQFRGGQTAGKIYGLTAVVNNPTQITVVARTQGASNLIFLRHGVEIHNLLTVVTRTEAPVPGTTHTFVMTGLTTKTNYYFQVYGTGAENLIYGGIGEKKTT